MEQSIRVPRGKVINKSSFQTVFWTSFVNFS